MKKIAVKMRKYINRISVLVTVFAVLVTASFYNPASLASDTSSLVWIVASTSSDGTSMTWNPSEHSFNSWTSTGSFVGSYSASGSYFKTYSGSSSTGNSGQTYHNSGTVNERLATSFHYAIPFYLSPIPARRPSDSYFVNGTLQLLLSFQLPSDWEFGSLFCSPVKVTGLLPDGTSVTFFQTGGTFTIPSDNTWVYLGFQLVFDNTEFSYLSDSFSFYVEFDASCFMGGAVESFCIAPAINLSYTSPAADITFSRGYAMGSNRDVVDGYDSSSGNASQSKLDISLSGQEVKEDSLFTSASDNLSKFTLSDFSAMPKVVAGLAFVSSTMTSIFESLGGVNGAGIVLSVGCSILFVSFCIGAYRFYSAWKG